MVFTAVRKTIGNELHFLSQHKSQLKSITKSLLPSKINLKDHAFSDNIYKAVTEKKH